MEVFKGYLSLIIFTCGWFSASYSQNTVSHLFPRNNTLYVSAGYLGGKRIVSGIQVKAKDSTNQEIQVKMELLKDWVPSDSATFILFLDTSKQEFISLDGRKYEAIHYRSEDSQVQINFGKPEEFTYYVKGGTEKHSAWNSNYAVVHYSNRLKKYNRVLKMYYEK